MVTKSARNKEKGSSLTRETTPDVTEAKTDILNEEEIRELAEILYHQRIDRGESGSATEDWLKAESYLRFPEN